MPHTVETPQSFQIRDDGSGFEAASAPAGMGIVNMEYRAQQMGGVTRIRSEQGVGTTVVVSLPGIPGRAALHL